MEVSAEELLRLLRVLRGYEAVVEDFLSRDIVPVMTLEALEVLAISESLRRNGGSQLKAARELGITTRVMSYKVTHHRELRELTGAHRGSGAAD